MSQNPQLLQSLLENDPTYSRLLQEHPELKGMLSDPTTLSMLNDPQIMNSALNMATRSQGNPTGAMSGNLSNFPMPGSLNRRFLKKEFLGGVDTTTQQINNNNAPANPTNLNFNNMNQQRNFFNPFGYKKPITYKKLYFFRV